MNVEQMILESFAEEQERKRREVEGCVLNRAVQPVRLTAISAL